MPRLAIALRLSAAAFALAPALAHAQAAGNLPIDTFRPAIDSRGYLTINASQTLGHHELSFGLGSLAWGHRLLELEGSGSQYSVDDVLTATLVAAYGLKLGPLDLQFGASVPFTVLSGDRGPDDAGALDNPNDDRDFALDGQGLGNIGLHLKTRFVKSSRAHGVGLGVIASVFLPTVSVTERFMGEQKTTPQLVAILDKEFGRTRRLRVALNGGIRLRPTVSFTDTGDMGAPPTNQTIRASAELPVGLGLAYAVSKGKLDVIAEVFGAVPIGEHEGYQPLEAIGGIKLYLARSSFLSLGAGRGLRPAEGANPDLRAFIGIVFEPNLGDRDGDGLKDDVDRCPSDPEDHDGFQDADGCPELDNDRDGILDEDDRCPLIPEDRDGWEDEDGCPDGDRNDRDGDTILDDADKCPDEPEDFDQFEDADGCPDVDNDRDGILDVDDLCPDAAEDVDQFEDEDGCPDADNDKDRILDTSDKCPNVKEEYNNVDDDDGCPDRGVIITRTDDIVILKAINFEYNSAKIDPGSFYILDAIVAALQGNPDIALLEVAGHTDERGNDAYNLDLSQRRVDAVVKYLVDKGIAPQRLTPEGYGETRPLDPRRNEAAWLANRRVEFLILKRN